MTDQKDIYRSAQIIINQHGAEAEQYALEKMQDFMDDENVVAAATWLTIAQAVHTLQQRSAVGTVH